MQKECSYCLRLYKSVRRDQEWCCKKCRRDWQYAFSKLDHEAVFACQTRREQDDLVRAYAKRRAAKRIARTHKRTTTKHKNPNGTFTVKLFINKVHHPKADLITWSEAEADEYANKLKANV